MILTSDPDSNRIGNVLKANNSRYYLYLLHDTGQYQKKKKILTQKKLGNKILL